jgi:hypothetical protein
MLFPMLGLPRMPTQDKKDEGEYDREEEEQMAQRKLFEEQEEKLKQRERDIVREAESIRQRVRSINPIEMYAHTHVRVLCVCVSVVTWQATRTLQRFASRCGAMLQGQPARMRCETAAIVCVQRHNQEHIKYETKMPQKKIVFFLLVCVGDFIVLVAFRVFVSL